MKKYLICLKSVIVLIVLKLLRWNHFFINGLPVSVGFRNIRNLGWIKLGKRINMYGHSELVSLKGSRLYIGDAVFFNRNCNVVCRNHIKIGNLCRFGPNVCIFDHDHEYSEEGISDKYKLGKVIIGDNCWLGANVVILRDSDIGEGCVIGAGVVFKGVLPPHSLIYYDKKNLVVKQINK